jgi:hypothetical protein
MTVTGSTVLAVTVVVDVNSDCRNDANMICVGNDPHLHLDGKQSLSVVLCTVESLFSDVVWILEDILIGGVVLVEQDDNTTLSFAVQPV